MAVDQLERMRAAIIAQELRSPIPVTAAGDSWRWQLRDSKGQWIEMGSEVVYLVRGLAHTGTIVGSPKEGSATVEDSETHKRTTLPASSLTVLSVPGRSAADIQQDLATGLQKALDTKSSRESPPGTRKAIQDSLTRVQNETLSGSDYSRMLHVLRRRTNSAEYDGEPSADFTKAASALETAVRDRQAYDERQLLRGWVKGEAPTRTPKLGETSVGKYAPKKGGLVPSVTVDAKTGRVTIDGKTWGKVRPNRAGETVHMGGRAWVAENRNGKRIVGTFQTRDDALRALAKYVGKPLPPKGEKKDELLEAFLESSDAAPRKPQYLRDTKVVTPKTTKGTLKAAPSGLPTAYPKNERAPDGRVIMTDAQLADITPKFGPHSIEKYLEEITLPDGRKVRVLSKEREALHNEMVRKSLEGVKPSGKNPPVYINHGGGPASGKSSVTKRMPGYPKVRSYADRDTEPPGAAVLIEGDEYKKAMPDWGQPDMNKTAGYTHEESSIIAKAVADAAMDRGLDVVLDGTGDSSAKKMNGKIDDYKARGYRVEGLYVTVPASEAMVRTLERSYAEGRYLSLNTLMDNHHAVTRTVGDVGDGGALEHYDKFDLWDTNVPFGQEPHPIVLNGEVVDEARWRSFQDKTTIEDLQTARDALEIAEAKQYTDVKRNGKVVATAEQLREYTISKIKRLISHLEEEERATTTK